MLPSRCAVTTKDKSGRTKAQAKQVRSEPACVSVMRGMEPGVARVQAVRLNPEICIVVVRKDNLLSRRKEKPTYCMHRKAAVLSYVMASKKGHHRGLRTGHVPTGVARELGRAYLSPCNELPVIKGCRLTKRVLA